MYGVYVLGDRIVNILSAVQHVWGMKCDGCVRKTLTETQYQVQIMCFHFISWVAVLGDTAD
jgi:hypothetical protein